MTDVREPQPDQETGAGQESFPPADGTAGTIRPIHYLLLALAVLVVHGPMLFRELVWDDILLIEHYEKMGYWKAFQTDAFGFVRPGKTLLFSVAHALFGYNSYGWQALSLLALLGVSLLALRFLSLWLSPTAALAGALIYAVHPLHVEGTGWFSASNGTWMALFALAYYLVFCSGQAMRSPAAVGAVTTVLFVAAFLMKEEAIVLPVLAALCLWYRRIPLRPGLLALLGGHLLIGVALTLFFRSAASRAGQTLHTFALPEALISISAFRVMASHALFFAWPFRWGYYRTFSYEPVQYTILAILALALAGWLAWRVWKRREKRSPAHLGLLFFVIGMLPLANVLPFGNDHYAVRYLTHAGLGLALLAGAGVQALLRVWRPLTVQRVLAVWLVAAFGASLLFHYHWRSTETLFRQIEKHTDSSLLLSVLATWLYRNGKDQEAVKVIRAATELLEQNVRDHTLTPQTRDLTEAQLLVLEGMIFRRHRNTEKALNRFQEAFRVVPGHMDAAAHLASLYDDLFTQSADRRYFDLAEQYYTVALDSPQNGETAHLNLGTLYAQDNQTTRAVELWKRGLQKFPGSRQLRHNLAIALRQ